MYEDHNHSKFWDQKYLNDEASWDINSANPVFVSLLSDQEKFPPGKILIMGCGKAYDVLAAARHGFNAVGIDFSAQAINIATHLAAKEKFDVTFLQQDFFLLDKKFNDSFDYVYDYTTLCAIDPSRKEEYARKVSHLLKKDGKFIAILFPVEKRETGPPFGLDVVEVYQIFSKYLRLKFYYRSLKSIKPREGREALQVYVKR